MKLLTTFQNWVKGLFSDEKGTASSKRFVGVMCVITLCISLYRNVFYPTSVSPSDELIDAIALLTFGCLGLTFIDKFTANRNNNNNI